MTLYSMCATFAPTTAPNVTGTVVRAAILDSCQSTVWAQALSLHLAISAFWWTPRPVRFRVAA